MFVNISIFCDYIVYAWLMKKKIIINKVSEIRPQTYTKHMSTRLMDVVA